MKNLVAIILFGIPHLSMADLNCRFTKDGNSFYVSFLKEDETELTKLIFEESSGDWDDGSMLSTVFYRRTTKSQSKTSSTFGTWGDEVAVTLNTKRYKAIDGINHTIKGIAKIELPEIKFEGPVSCSYQNGSYLP